MKLSIWWKIFLWASGITGLLVVGGIGYVAYQMAWERAHRTSVEIYKDAQFNAPRNPFMTEAFLAIASAKPHETALVLEAQVAESDINLLLEKGYSVVGLDTLTILYTLLIGDIQKYKDKINIIEGSQNLDFEKVPPLQVVMASFFIPFFPAEDTEYVWQGETKTLRGSNWFWKGINDKLQPGGYFVGNFLDPATTIFHDQNPKDMTFHTKDQVLALFKDYEILKLNEVKQTTAAGFEHRYEVFARKK